ncbi:MAG: hypothetical protein ABJF10_17370 [Chthoniobacter sp.]|uniref:hypothetical protein n=1 Tax=Chthoniobacter sp. TaxID=2510640 RepID=UPI0032A83847
MKPPPNICPLVIAALMAGGCLQAQQPRPDAQGHNAEANQHLATFLVGTKWLMYEIPGRIVEFGEDGKFDLDDWKMQGIEAKWKVTGPSQVTVTVISVKAKDQTAILNFDAKLSSFTGNDLDPRRKISKSPRINRVPNDPADPYHR